VLSRGDEWIFAQNIGHVVKFLGLNEATGPVLSPVELMQRLDLFVRTAIQIVPQMPDSLLSTEVPNRPRSYLALSHHLFRIPEGMLEVAAGATLVNDMLTGGPTPDMKTSASIAAYGQQVLAEMPATAARTDGAHHLALRPACPPMVHAARYGWHNAGHDSGRRRVRQVANAQQRLGRLDRANNEYRRH
jgi:hypothetical protein